MPLAPRLVATCGGVGEHVLTEPEQLATYDCDGLTGLARAAGRGRPPGSSKRSRPPSGSAPATRAVRRARRGHGPLGRRAPVAEGVVISVARMNRILEIDLESQRVVVEPGVANLDVTQAVAADGYFYAPDPSSQQVCTIGGNVAENSGGAHCLKHGFTVNHVTGCDVVLPTASCSSSAASRSTATAPTCSA